MNEGGLGALPQLGKGGSHGMGVTVSGLSPTSALRLSVVQSELVDIELFLG